MKMDALAWLIGFVNQFLQFSLYDSISSWAMPLIEYETPKELIVRYNRHLPQQYL